MCKFHQTFFQQRKLKHLIQHLIQPKLAQTLVKLLDKWINRVSLFNTDIIIIFLKYQMQHFEYYWIGANSIKLSSNRESSNISSNIWSNQNWHKCWSNYWICGSTQLHWAFCTICVLIWSYFMFYDVIGSEKTSSVLSSSSSSSLIYRLFL